MLSFVGVVGYCRPGALQDHNQQLLSRCTWYYRTFLYLQQSPSGKSSRFSTAGTGKLCANLLRSYCCIYVSIETVRLASVNVVGYVVQEIVSCHVMFTQRHIYVWLVKVIVAYAVWTLPRPCHDNAMQSQVCL